MEEEWAKYFEEIDDMIDSTSVSSTLDSPADLKWKVPVAGVLYAKPSVSRGLDLKSSYAALRNSLKSTSSLGGTAVGSYGEQSVNYAAALQDTVRGWRFVITKRGYAGIVQARAQVGDTVAILEGARVPFVLQKSATSLDAFRLVGECYVHGMMNGQGLILPRVARSEFRLH